MKIFLQHLHDVIFTKFQSNSLEVEKSFSKMFIVPLNYNYNSNNKELAAIFKRNLQKINLLYSHYFNLNSYNKLFYLYITHK